jgi:hypothetical protein
MRSRLTTHPAERVMGRFARLGTSTLPIQFCVETGAARSKNAHEPIVTG